MRVKGQPKSLDYFFEMLAALQTADDVTSFYIARILELLPLFLRHFPGSNSFSR